MVFEAFETFLHLDSKIFRTLKALIIKPGSLTQLYWSGKRVPYVPPVRLYIMISILFFFTLSVAMHDSRDRDQDKPSVELTYHSVKSSELRGLDSRQIDSVMIARGIPRSAVSRYMLDQLSKIGSEGIQSFMTMMIKNVSYMIFILMPLFGWLVYVMHIRLNRYFIECAVFSVHYHGFIFMMLFLLLLVSMWFTIQIYTFLAVLLLFPTYLGLALKRNFGRGTLMTIVKTIVLTALHGLSVFILFILTVIFSIIMF